MIEYELSVNVKVESEIEMENLLITIESLNPKALSPSSIELVNFNVIEANKLPPNPVEGVLAQHFEFDPWLSPMEVKSDVID